MLNYGDFGVETPMSQIISQVLDGDGTNPIDVLHSMMQLIDYASIDVDELIDAINQQIAMDMEYCSPNVGGHDKIMQKEVEQLHKLVELAKTWQKMDWEM